METIDDDCEDDDKMESSFEEMDEKNSYTYKEIRKERAKRNKKFALITHTCPFIHVLIQGEHKIFFF